MTKDISLDGEPWIQLIRPTKTTAAETAKVMPTEKSKGKPGSPIPAATLQESPPQGTNSDATKAERSDDASARELLQSAGEQIRSGDWEGAAAALDKVKTKNANEECLWGSYGVIARKPGRVR